MRKIHINKGIVPQDDTTDTSCEIKRATKALHYRTKTVQSEEQVYPTGTNNGSEYTIHKIVHHEQQENVTTIYRTRWYYVCEKDDTLELVTYLSRSKVVQ